MASRRAWAEGNGEPGPRRGGRPLLGSAGHRPWWRAVRFVPPLRDPRAGLACHREVRCQACADAHLGEARDPFEALLIAWHHARAARRGART